MVSNCKSQLGVRSVRRRIRPGTGMLDLLVSFTLLITLISVATPMVVRHGRLLTSHRNYRVALDELSNQFDRLAALPANQIPGALERISPSKFLLEQLPAAVIVGDSEPVEFGSRITLRLSWNEVGRDKAPVTLAGWIPLQQVPEHVTAKGVAP